MKKRKRNERIGRNDICPCGCGRKFKKCASCNPYGFIMSDSNRVIKMLSTLPTDTKVFILTGENDYEFIFEDELPVVEAQLGGDWLIQCLRIGLVGFTPAFEGGRWVYGMRVNSDGSIDIVSSMSFELEEYKSHRKRGCTKVTYATKHDALKALKNIKKSELRNDTGGYPKNTYRCDKCGSHHLT